MGWVRGGVGVGIGSGVGRGEGSLYDRYGDVRVRGVDGVYKMRDVRDWYIPPAPHGSWKPK